MSEHVFSPLCLTALLAISGAIGGCGPPEDEGAAQGAPQEVRIKIDLPGDDDDGGGGGAGKAEISLDSTLVFFPQICPGAESKKTLSLRNRGEDPLIIRKLDVDGSAFALLEKPKLPKTLKTGERLELTVGYSPPANRPDKLDHQGMLRITSNDRRREVTSIPLRGLVPPQTLSLSIRQLKLGELGVGESRSRSLTLRNNGQCVVNVAGYEPSGAQDEGVFVDGLRQGPLSPGHTDRVTVTGMCLRSGELNVKIRFLTPSGATMATGYVTALCD